MDWIEWIPWGVWWMWWIILRLIDRHTPPTLLQSVIYSKKCSTYWLSQIDDLLCWLYRHDGEIWCVFVERRYYTDVELWYEGLKHLMMSVLHFWQSVSVARVTSALCYLNIWAFSMINLSYVLHWTIANLYSAGHYQIIYSCERGCLKDRVFPC